VLRTVGDDAGAHHASAQARAVLAGCPDPGVLGERAPGQARARHRTPGEPGTPTLTPSELRVLAHLDGSATEADIARELFVTHSTVHSHTKAIYRKLGVTARAQAVARAAELGLLP
jgi:LuxR family maltose regulon positive regulatory protein